MSGITSIGSVSTTSIVHTGAALGGGSPGGILSPPGSAGTGQSAPGGGRLLTSASLSTSIFETAMSGLSQRDQRFAAVALNLLGILLGLDEREDKRKKSAAMLAALMLPALMGRSESRLSIVQTQVSQYSEGVSYSSSSAVQPGSYGQMASSVSLSFSSVGQSLSIVA